MTFNFPTINRALDKFKVSSSGIKQSNGEYLRDASIFSINHDWPKRNIDLFSSVSSRLEENFQNLNNEIFVKDDLGYACNWWDANYQHFLIETFPKINLLYELGVSIVVFDRPFIRDICSTVFPDAQFIYLKERDFISHDGAIYVVESIFRNFSEMPTYLIKSLNNLSSKVVHSCTSFSADSDGVFYLGRANDSKNTGHTRSCINFTEFDATLKKYNCSTLYMENLTILEKASILQGKKKIISPIGANLMNFIFLREDVRIGVIGHPGLNQFKWFQKLLMSVNPSLNIILFDEVYAENSTQNSPYSVNIEEFVSWISNI